MIVYEIGPFAVFEKVRSLVYAKATPHWIIEGFNCVLCISFWLSMIGALFTEMKRKKDFFVSWFGIAGGVAFIHLFIENLEVNEFNEEL